MNYVRAAATPHARRVLLRGFGTHSWDDWAKGPLIPCNMVDTIYEQMMWKSIYV